MTTAVFGVLYVIGGLASLGSSRGIVLMGFIQLVMGIIMCCVVCDKYSVGLRKCIFFSYIIYCVLLALGLIICIVLILSHEELYEQTGNAEIDRFNEAVDNSLRGVLIALVCIWASIFVPATLIGLEVAYYGWKELEFGEQGGEVQQKVMTVGKKISDDVSAVEG